MKVETFERRGVFRRWEKTDEFEYPEDGITDRGMLQDWMLWAAVKRGRDIRVTFNSGMTFG